MGGGRQGQGGAEAPRAAGNPQRVPSGSPGPISTAPQQILEFLTSLGPDLWASVGISPPSCNPISTFQTSLSAPPPPSSQALCGGWRGRISISDPGSFQKPCPQALSLALGFFCRPVPPTRAANPNVELSALAPPPLPTAAEGLGALGMMKSSQKEEAKDVNAPVKSPMTAVTTVAPAIKHGALTAPEITPGALVSSSRSSRVQAVYTWAHVCVPGRVCTRRLR